MFILDSSYGVTVGGLFVHRNVFGELEHFALRAGTADAQLRHRHGEMELRWDVARTPSIAPRVIGIWRS